MQTQLNVAVPLHCVGAQSRFQTPQSFVSQTEVVTLPASYMFMGTKYAIVCYTSKHLHKLNFNTMSSLSLAIKFSRSSPTRHGSLTLNSVASICTLVLLWSGCLISLSFSFPIYKRRMRVTVFIPRSYKCNREEHFCILFQVNQ